MKNIYNITDEMINKEKIKTCNTANKIMIVGTLDTIIDMVDAFLMIHSQATLQDFINFLRRTRRIYLGQGEEIKQ